MTSGYMYRRTVWILYTRQYIYISVHYTHSIPLSLEDLLDLTLVHRNNLCTHQSQHPQYKCSRPSKPLTTCTITNHNTHYMHPHNHHNTHYMHPHNHHNTHYMHSHTSQHPLYALSHITTPITIPTYHLDVVSPTICFTSCCIC